MKSLSLILGFCLIICSGYSQQSGCACSAEEDYGIRLQEGLIGFEFRVSVNDNEGLQYFNNWALGQVILQNGDVLQNIYLRYNKYLDELLWLRQIDFSVGILKKEGIAGFRIFEDINQISALFVKKKVILSRTDTTEAYLHLLASGPLTLYAYRNINIANSRYELADNTKYLITTGGIDFFVTPKRKSLLEVPVIDKTEMKNILRANRIALENNERELTRAISIYNAVHH
jgi:hypothetical protein